MNDQTKSDSVEKMTLKGLAEYELRKARAEAAAVNAIAWMLRSKSTGAAWIDEGCLWSDYDDAAAQAETLNVVGDEGEEPHDWEPRGVQFMDGPKAPQTLDEFLQERAEYLEKAKNVNVGHY